MEVGSLLQTHKCTHAHFLIHRCIHATASTQQASARTRAHTHSLSLCISRPFKSQPTQTQALPLPEMTTETAAEIGRKRLVDSSALKKKIYIHIYKKTLCPSPMNGSRQLLPAGAGERDMDTARFLEGSTLLSLQFNVGVQAASPSGKERLP